MKWPVAVMSWLKASRCLCTSDPSEQAVLNWIFLYPNLIIWTLVNEFSLRFRK